MKINSINIINLNKNNLYSSNPISFTGYKASRIHQDTFDRNNASIEDYAKVKDARRELEATGFDEVASRYSSINDESDFIAYKRDKSNELIQMYKTINDILNDSKAEYVEQDQKILKRMCMQVANLENQGFKRILGYDSIKAKLNREYVFGVMGRAKTSQKVDVPDAILLFGPSGCGKSTFARALAEQTLSNVEEITVDRQDTSIEQIKQALKESEKNYKESGEDKQRTIIILDECDALFTKESPFLDEFKELMKDCSKKYHCTFFMTTNSIFKMDDEILSKEVTPIKIPVPPPDTDAIRAFLKAKIKDEDFTVAQIEQLVALYQTPNGGRRSIGDYEYAIRNALMNNIDKDLKVEDYAKEIMYFPPSCRKREIDTLNNQIKYLKDNNL